ncbi:toxin-activating lysine-acyltransferase [Pseudomonas marginalis]|uniref:toxin-activating lysine-acyltransferase n=1 Tax=Pseudomonas marginalis TaxID=298 RepID=UPI0034D50650
MSNKKLNFITHCRNDSFLERAGMIGTACSIAMRCQLYFSLRLIDIRAWLMPAINHKQILFFYDGCGDPVGYITWANLAPDSEQRLLNDTNFLLHESEWDEGAATWIIDCCFPFGGAAYALDALKQYFREHDTTRISWVRRNSDYSVRKVIRCSI